MDFKKVTDQAKDAIDTAREKAEDLAEQAVHKVDEVTGGKVPDAVKKAVDKIDSKDDTPEPPAA